MKYISEFRDHKLVGRITHRISRIAKGVGKQIRLMEVCGTHTMAILRYGIKELIPPNIKLVSGPGCPVCVTPTQYIDRACAYADKGFLIATFGDMMRVPGSEGSLVEEKSKGRKVRVVYSAMDALKLAKSFPEEKVILLGIGFETTAPTIAASISVAKEEGIRNFMVLCGHKLIPPAMKALMESGEVRINGFLCPGHVSTIIGSRAYEFLARDYDIPCVVTGFEPLDILQGVNLLISQIYQGEAKVENEYARVVTLKGNPAARGLLKKVFRVSDSQWRGMGIIKDSGFSIAKDYSWYDVQTRYPVEVTSSREKEGCRCGEVLRGLIEPWECALFRNPCNPSNPFGPCMVSIEGACNIHYRFGHKGKL
ncbi:hydrogenase formation protein HypD [Patescibacteria group bacterium]|nr:hydrogenase formation protein HypD [Patescibacteria group bacterium]